VTLRIVGRREGQRLNREFRGKDYPTNVLTFAYGEDGHGVFQGDIAICWPVIKSEARAQKKTALQHMAHIVVHGMLHLQGLDHDSPKKARVMESLETRILAHMGIPDPYHT
jgi:probable rRNA maturation factor